MTIHVVNISIQAEGSENLRKAAEILSAEGLDIKIFSTDYRDLEKDSTLLWNTIDAMKKADFIIIRCMAEPSRFKRYGVIEPIIQTCSASVLIFSGTYEMRSLYKPLFNGSDEDYLLLCNYLTYKGLDNEKGLLLWINKHLGGPAIPVPEPVIPRLDGIYHPRMDRDISYTDYVSSLDPAKPTVGVVITQTDWMDGRISHIDRMILKLEEVGLNTIPIFYSHLAPPVNNEQGISVYIRKYFMNNDKSLIDVLLLTISSSNLLHSKKRQESGFGVEFSDNFYKTLTDVPVIQALCIHNTWSDFENDSSGLDGHDISILVIRPELDGQILGTPIGCITEDSNKRLMPIEPGINHVARMCLNWAILRRKPANERKIAIIMYQPRDDSSCIGSSGGLDVQQSVVEMLKQMKSAGYSIDRLPENGNDLVFDLISRVTNDLNNQTDAYIAEHAAGIQSVKDYTEVFASVPAFNQKRLIDHWGNPPGNVTVIPQGMVMPGVLNGNILITYQPIRAWGEQTDALYHDPVLPAPHQYLGFYRWLKDVYHADAVIHMGTHGSMEWLPGKSVGLSNKCEPCMILNGIPDIYPFCIDDPGEGIQAKRRVEAVLIGYLNPTMTRAGDYEDLSKLESLLREYFSLRNTPNDTRRELMCKQIRDEVCKLNLNEDLDIPEEIELDQFEKCIIDVHTYVSDFKDALIPDGLHVLGKNPADRHLDECIYSMLRIKNGEIPSLRTAYASCMGIDIEDCLAHPSEVLPTGELKGDAVDRIDTELSHNLTLIRENGYDKTLCFDSKFWKVELNAVFKTVLEFLLNEVVPRLLHTKDEMDSLLTAMDGRYVYPGPSGPPTRGNVKVLPSGRNFYGIDPDSVPTSTAWEIGRRMADQMLDRYRTEHGHYPHEIAMVIWATDTMKTNGDDVGYILWLMGVRPIWSKTGDLVEDLEVIPLSELGRPRIDVTIRITGLFRDAYPNLVEMFNDAVELVADLDEDDEENYIAASIRKDLVDEISKGIAHDEAIHNSKLRVFGSPPGSYGGGINLAIAASEWKTTEDLADICVTWSSYAYGRGLYGAKRPEQFKRRLSNSDVTVKNMPDREHDILAMDEVFEYMGGLNAFVKAYGKKDAMFFIGDDSDPDNSKLRTTSEECRFIFRSKVLNPKWLNGIKEHGYRGAQELSKLAEYMIGWDGTSDSIDDWMYEAYTNKFLLDEETHKWLRENNPYALLEILKRMQEAIDRGLWETSKEMRYNIKNLFLDAEEFIEEITDQ